ncbi:MAG TPA: amidophosphoribosyltransferase [Paenalcaligenes sp.]|nr:amidophosphoribosyltransferase [Paenalcaligenes sp.]
MCGVVGAIGRSSVNQLIYDSLLLLQHRGQEAAGISTYHDQMFFAHHGAGLVRDVFRTRNMRSLPGNSGLGHVRYPASSSPESIDEAQPLYVNAPYGISFVHNGQLTNWKSLREDLFKFDRRHINTQSDSEVLLNIFAHELQLASANNELKPEIIFKAVRAVHKRVKGAYAVIAHIAGFGLVAFRDPNGIRPLCYGKLDSQEGREWLVASESVALTGNGFRLVDDVAPGEALCITHDGQLVKEQCAESTRLMPCMFEYVYFARPDSIIDGISIYHARLKMGEYLGNKVAKNLRLAQIDVVMPIPDSARPSAMQLASSLNLPYREGFLKNYYIGRTFIMPGQAVRQRSVRQKLSALPLEFKDKNVLLVDDSIVRGTTSKRIVEIARWAGAKKVFFASAAAPVRFPNIYGIDMPTKEELIAHTREVDNIVDEIGADGLIFQNLGDLYTLLHDLNPKIDGFEASCFHGHYITEDDEALSKLQLELGQA